MRITFFVFVNKNKSQLKQFPLPHYLMIIAHQTPLIPKSVGVAIK